MHEESGFCLLEGSEQMGSLREVLLYLSSSWGRCQTSEPQRCRLWWCAFWEACNSLEITALVLIFYAIAFYSRILWNLSEVIYMKGLQTWRKESMESEEFCLTHIHKLAVAFVDSSLLFGLATWPAGS